jgi:hypothetical protein
MGCYSHVRPTSWGSCCCCAPAPTVSPAPRGGLPLLYSLPVQALLLEELLPLLLPAEEEEDQQRSAVVEVSKGHVLACARLCLPVLVNTAPGTPVCCRGPTHPCPVGWV